MSKQLVLFIAAATAALASAASAAAYVTPPVDRSGVHSLTTCLYSGTTPPPPGVLGGNGDSKGTISPTTDLWLSAGWGANTQSQVNNFLGAQYGSIVISQYDGTNIGPTVKSVNWGDPSTKKQTDVSLWTAPAAMNDPTLNGGKPFWNTKFFWNVGQLASGTYWVSPNFVLTQAQFDGSTTVKAGPYFTTGCELVVGS